MTMTNVDTAAATVVETAKKVTLNSLLFAAAPVLRVLAEGEEYSKEELAEHKAAVSTFIDGQSTLIAEFLYNKLADPSIVVQILKSVPKKIEAARVAAEEASKKAEEDARLEAERIEKERSDLAAKWLAEFQASGFDLEVAQAMIETGLAKKYGTASTEKKAERIVVVVEGVEYEVPVRGNFSPAVKEVMKSTGYEGNRAGFIEAYRKVPA